MSWSKSCWKLCTGSVFLLRLRASVWKGCHCGWGAGVLLLPGMSCCTWRTYCCCCSFVAAVKLTSPPRVAAAAVLLLGDAARPAPGRQDDGAAGTRCPILEEEGVAASLLCCCPRRLPGSGSTACLHPGRSCCCGLRVGSGCLLLAPEKVGQRRVVAGVMPGWVGVAAQSTADQQDSKKQAKRSGQGSDTGDQGRNENPLAPTSRHGDQCVAAWLWAKPKSIRVGSRGTKRCKPPAVKGERRKPKYSIALIGH